MNLTPQRIPQRWTHTVFVIGDWLILLGVQHIHSCRTRGSMLKNPDLITSTQASQFTVICNPTSSGLHGHQNSRAYTHMHTTHESVHTHAARVHMHAAREYTLKNNKSNYLLKIHFVISHERISFSKLNTYIFCIPVHLLMNTGLPPPFGWHAYCCHELCVPIFSLDRLSILAGFFK